MNVKAQWLDKFQELLWEHHTCDWIEGNRNPNYPFQLAVAYFDWGSDDWDFPIPEETAEQAFSRYLEAQE